MADGLPDLWLRLPRLPTRWSAAARYRFSVSTSWRRRWPRTGCTVLRSRCTRPPWNASARLGSGCESAIFSIFRAISSAAEQTFSLQERLQSLMHAVVDGSAFDAAGIWLVDPSGATMTVRAEHGRPVDYAEAFSTYRFLSSFVTTDPNASRDSNDVASHPIPRIRDVLVRNGYQTSGRVPLIAEGKLVGLLGLADRHRRSSLPMRSRCSAAIGQQMGAFIHHAELYETTQRQLAERTEMMAEIVKSDRRTGGLQCDRRRGRTFTRPAGAARSLPWMLPWRPSEPRPERSIFWSQTGRA